MSHITLARNKLTSPTRQRGAVFRWRVGLVSLFHAKVIRSRNFPPLSVPCRNSNISIGLVHVCHALSGKVSLLIEQKIQCPTPSNMRARTAKVGQNVNVLGTSVFQRVGKHSKMNRVEFARRQDTLFIGG
jgi:hypothetical protein